MGNISVVGLRSEGAYQNIRQICLDNNNNGITGEIYANIRNSNGEWQECLRQQYIFAGEHECMDLVHCPGINEGTEYQIGFHIGSTSAHALIDEIFVYSAYGDQVNYEAVGSTVDNVLAQPAAEELTMLDIPTDTCFGNSCYALVASGENFGGGRNHCAGLGGTLAVITSDEENEVVKKVLNRSGAQYAWIGLSRGNGTRNTPSAYHFNIDNTVTTYRHWHTGSIGWSCAVNHGNCRNGEPSLLGFFEGQFHVEHAVAMNSNGDWGDLWEGQPLPSLCEIPMEVVKGNAPYN